MLKLIISNELIMFISKLNVVVISVYAIQIGLSQRVGDLCVGSQSGKTGNCQLFSKCSPALANLMKGVHPEVCSYQMNEPVVCCPSDVQKIPEPSINQFQPSTSSNSEASEDYIITDEPKSSAKRPEQEVNQNRELDKTDRISVKKCKEYAKLTLTKRTFAPLSLITDVNTIYVPTCVYTSGLIVGGELAKPGEFPHMAAIGWSEFGTVNWNCGGTLISEKFILSAGHCMIFDGFPPNIVRLGDQNLIKSDDAAQPQDYIIAEIFKHPLYRGNSHYNDIALILLGGEVRFSSFIRPACLWQSTYVNSSLVVATGWGLIEYAGQKSDDLRKVSLDILDNVQCNKLYDTGHKLKDGITNTQICAGYKPGGRDTCQGDSGGPIQLVTSGNECVFHIIGVTSFGHACAEENSFGVYTRVSEFLDWIESVVWK